MSSQAFISNATATTLAAVGDGYSVPRMPTAQRLAIVFGASDQGMMVYDTTLNNLFIWTGAAWESVPASGDAGPNGAIQYNDNGVVSGAANLQYDKAGGFTSLRSGSALRAYVADNSVYSTISDQGAAGGLTIDNLNADGISLKIGSVNAYTLSAGVATWYDGAGGTRMTLNSTGLGVGTVPSGSTGNSKISIVGGVTYDGNFDIIGNFTSSATASTAKGVLLGYNNSTNNGIISAAYGGGTEGLTFWTHNGTSWGQRMELNASGNLGIGVTPSAWASSYKALQFGQSASVSGFSSELAVFGSNCYFDTTDSRWERITSGFTSQYYQTSGTHVWRIGGTAGANTDCAFTQAMTLDASGNLLVGTTVISPSINGPGAITAKGVAGITAQTVSALLTDYTLPIGAFAGILTIRSNGAGGSAVWMLDPNAGAVSISNNIVGRTITFTFSGGSWKLQQTVGAVPSTYNYLVLATQ